MNKLITANKPGDKKMPRSFDEVLGDRDSI